ncbi:hypothetical protein TSUD_206250 [Trifolium subterraneum]|uniref:Uncharacterized protein n=1 Tax=Trifolium subterraneum TaxID=3900 RepID=A0A2Z6MKS1_TRISU|nr:hypothetical protein TSUD_206250 [Trifolium subterraneum]
MEHYKAIIDDCLCISPSELVRTRTLSSHVSMEEDPHQQLLLLAWIWRCRPPKMECCIHIQWLKKNATAKSKASNEILKLFPEAILYLESSSNRKEVLTALEESSATIALMVVVTCIVHRIVSKFVSRLITSSQVFPAWEWYKRCVI